MSPTRTVVGFVAPLAAEAERYRLDLNEAVGGAHAGRYVVALDSHTTVPLCPRAGDLAVVDCARAPTRGCVAVVEHDGVLAIETLARAPRPTDPPVFGVVTHLLLRLVPDAGERIPEP